MFDIDADLASVLAEDLAALPARQSQLDAAGDLTGRMDRAWGRMDAFELVAAGRALERRGELDRRGRIRFAIALIELGFPDQAAAALDASACEDQTAGVLARRAEALAICGRFGEAATAIARARKMHPQLDGAEAFGARLGKIRRHIGRAEQSWEMAAYVLALMAGLRARGASAEVVRRLLAAPPALDAQTAPHACRFATAALGLVPAAELQDLVAALGERFAADPAVQTLRLRWLVRAGRAQAAAELALASPAVGDRALTLAQAEALESAGDPAAAIGRLGALAAQDEADHEAAAWFAYCVGRYALDPAPAYAAPRPRRVINVFPFYNELTILKIRLREMASWVDQFVLVEAAQTFTGRPKPFYFDDFRAAVAEFEPKIVRARLPAFPEPVDRLWGREFYQRDVGVSALEGLWRPDDQVLVTDVDEIVDRRALEGLDLPLASLRMRTHRYFLNYCAKPGTPFASRRSGFVCRADVLRRFGSTYVRIGLLNRMDRWWNLPDAGWHLTSIGDADAIADKFRNFSHQEANKAAMRDTPSVAQRLQSLQAGSLDPLWERRDVDDSFPIYIREHHGALKPLLLGED